MKNSLLIVDDDPDFLEWLDFGLRKDGKFEIYTAPDAKGALLFLEKTIPAVIVIDLKLPDMDGFELTKKIRQNEHTAAVPIIMVTGVYKEIEYKEKGYSLGADDFLVKPFSYDQLLVRINKLLGIRR